MINISTAKLQVRLNNQLQFFAHIILDFADNSTKARGYIQHGIYQNVRNELNLEFFKSRKKYFSDQHAEHEPETSIERYKRLMAELQELEEEFNQVNIFLFSFFDLFSFYLQTSKDDLNKEESENLNALVQHIQKLQEHTSKVYGAKFLLNGRDARQG